MGRLLLRYRPLDLAAVSTLLIQAGKMAPAALVAAVASAENSARYRNPKGGGGGTSLTLLERLYSNLKDDADDAGDDRAVVMIGETMLDMYLSLWRSGSSVGGGPDTLRGGRRNSNIGPTSEQASTTMTTMTTTTTTTTPGSDGSRW